MVTMIPIRGFTDFTLEIILSVLQMSERIGMADGRCYTINTSSKLFNDYVMQKNKIYYEDNYTYRKMLQQMGPAIFNKDFQGAQCSRCDTALLSVPNTY